MCVCCAKLFVIVLPLFNNYVILTMVINMFKEKLSFLMTITNTTNADLARTISIAPSCISRWRTGKRLPPKQESHISSLVNYFYKK